MEKIHKTLTSSKNEKGKQIDLTRMRSKRSVDEYGKPTERLELASVSTRKKPRMLGGHIWQGDPYITEMKQFPYEPEQSSDSEPEHPMDDFCTSMLERVANNQEAPQDLRNRVNAMRQAREGQNQQEGINAYNHLLRVYESHANIEAVLRRYDPDSGSNLDSD